jgi:hypothetical protein
MVTTAYLVKKLGVMSIANLGAIFGMIVGIIEGIILAINIGSSSAIPGGSLMLSIGSGIMTFCANVIFMTFFGFLGGAVIAIIYNFVVRERDGIEVELEVSQ